ncbi:MAG: universal stress protein [Alphaproteobacteria bacterium]|nr:universal stress protein [Alphaproteobacteria bacterium]
MERLLVALDGSSHSDKALELAADLAETYGAELLLAHVMSSAPLDDAERQLAAAEYADELAAGMTTRAKTGTGGLEGGGHELLMHYTDLTHHFRETMGEHLIASAKKKLGDRKIESVQVLLAEGDPAETIVGLAKDRKVDAIVMGSRGLSDIKGLFLGSVSHKVGHLAECTCITVK